MKFKMIQKTIEKIDIKTLKGKEILRLIRLCHPNEKGEPYSRSEVMDEIQRRRLSLLKEIGWSINLDSIYKNRYTAHEETLKQLLIGYGKGRIAECSELFSVMEHCTPKELWVDDDVMNEYNPKGKLDGWIK